MSLTGQFASVDEDLTGRENLVLLGRLLGFSRRRGHGAGRPSCSSAFGLADAADRQVQDYSGGMRRRLDIAASIVVTPELLFLDEPTTGLDPRSRNQVWEIVRALVAEGTTVLLTTQYLDEADQLADRHRHDRPRQGHRRGHQRRAQGVGRRRHRCTSGCVDPSSGPRPSGCWPGARRARSIRRRRPGGAVRPVADPERVAARRWPSCHAAGIAVTEFALGQPSLDEVFLALTGHPAEEHRAEEDAA